MTAASSDAASSTPACQKHRGSSLSGRPIIPESRHRPVPPRNRWSDTPSASHARASSPTRYSPSSSGSRCRSAGGMISPSSPRVHVTSVTPAPSAAYLAIVAPVPIDSSSGCACTSNRLRSMGRFSPASQKAARAVWTEERGAQRRATRDDAAGRRLGGEQDENRAGKIAGMTDSFPRQQARTRRFTLGVPRSFQISPDGSRVAFLRSKGGGDPVTCLWVLDVGTGTERLVADPAELAAGEVPAEEKARRERSRE